MRNTNKEKKALLNYATSYRSYREIYNICNKVGEQRKKYSVSRKYYSSVLSLSVYSSKSE